MNRTFSALFFVLAALVFPVVALADDGQEGGGPGRSPLGMMRPQPALLGTVSSVDGATITISARGESLTVDASSATIVRVPDTAIQASDIQVGDSVLVQGSLSGSTISATRIMDGLSTNAGGRPGMMGSSTEHMGPPRSDEGSSDAQGNDDEENNQGGDQGRGDHRPMIRPNGTTTGMMDDRGDQGPRGEHDQNASSTNAGNRFGWLIGIGNMLFNRHSDQGEKPGQGNGAFATGGRVASVDGTTFAIEMPGRGDTATTTITVTTDASTTFMLVGSGPSTLSALTVGVFANVHGTMTSTTSRTIAATRVEIATTSPSVRGPSQADMQQLQEHMQQREDGDQGTSTPVQHFFKNVFERFSSFFHF